MTITWDQVIEWARSIGYLGPDEQPASQTERAAIFWLYKEAHVGWGDA